MISKRLRARIKLSRHRQYEIAQAAGIHPTVLSRIINNAEPVEQGDHRVTALGRVMGLEPEQCFASEEGLRFNAVCMEPTGAV